MFAAGEHFASCLDKRMAVDDTVDMDMIQNTQDMALNCILKITN